MRDPRHDEVRPGYTLVTHVGRAYPTPDQAIAKLMLALTKDGISVPPENIWAEEETPGAICPYGAYAWIPEKEH